MEWRCSGADLCYSGESQSHRISTVSNELRMRPEPEALPRWQGSRYLFALFYLLSLVGMWQVLRLRLVLAFQPDPHPAWP